MVAQLIEIIGFIEVENSVDEFVRSAIITDHISQLRVRSWPLRSGFENK